MLQLENENRWDHFFRIGVGFGTIFAKDLFPKEGGGNCHYCRPHPPPSTAFVPALAWLQSWKPSIVSPSPAGGLPRRLASSPGTKLWEPPTALAPSTAIVKVLSGRLLGYRINASVTHGIKIITVAQSHWEGPTGRFSNFTFLFECAKGNRWNREPRGHP